MTDPDFIDKRLTLIADNVDQVRRLVRPEAIATDPFAAAFAERKIQTAVQAMLDVASSILAKQRLGEPGTNAGMLEKLGQAGWIPAARVATYRRIVGFRNVLVHGYLDVDAQIVRAIVETHLDDLLEFVKVVRARLAR